MGQFIQSPTHSTTSNVVRPHDQNDFDAYMASGFIVTINARVATKEATPAAEDVSVGEQIDDEKQRSGKFALPEEWRD